jgi:hypothetical protein
MLELLIGMDIARKRSEEQFAHGPEAAVDASGRKTRPPGRRMWLFRRSRTSDCGQSRPGVAGRANAV